MKRGQTSLNEKTREVRHISLGDQPRIQSETISQVDEISTEKEHRNNQVPPYTHLSPLLERSLGGPSGNDNPAHRSLPASLPATDPCTSDLLRTTPSLANGHLGSILAAPETPSTPRIVLSPFSSFWPPDDETAAGLATASDGGSHAVLLPGNRGAPMALPPRTLRYGSAAESSVKTGDVPSDSDLWSAGVSTEAWCGPK